MERYEDGSVELYHLGRDLDESEDVADDHPERVKRMRKKLHRW